MKHITSLIVENLREDINKNRCFSGKSFCFYKDEKISFLKAKLLKKSEEPTGMV